MAEAFGPLLTLKEAGRYIRYSERSMRGFVADGTVKALRVGGSGKLLFRREDLDAAMHPVGKGALPQKG